MKRILPIVMIFAIILSTLSILASQGKSETILISNADFEQQLNYWSTSTGTATYTADSSDPHGGSYCAKGVELNVGSLGRLYQDVTGLVGAGGEYKISGWIKTSNVVGFVVIGLDYVASDGWTPADGYVEEIGHVSGTQNWTYYESNVFTLPPMPSDASATWFLFDFNAGKGTAWWDDVSLLEVTPPPVPATVYVDPQESFASPGETFSIDVILEDVTTLFGWEAKLFWDNSLLNCTAEEYPILPPGLNWEAPNSLLLGPGIQNDYNATHGRWYRGLSAMPLAAPMPEPFTGTIKLVTLTFEAKAVGICNLALLDVALRGRNPLTTTAYPRWSDINNDGVVDIFDVVIVAMAFGSEPGDPNWNQAADLDDDDKVDITDVVIIVSDLGKSAGDPFWGVTYTVYDIPATLQCAKVVITSTRVYVNPQVSSASLRSVFSVDIVLENVTNLFGWEFRLFWDNSLLECIAEEYPFYPPGLNWEPPNSLGLGPGIEQEFNETHGRWYHGLSALPMAPPFPEPFTGTIKLATLTFYVKAQGSCSLDIRDTILSDAQAMLILHTTEDGFFLCARIPVGGVWTRTNKFELLTPWIGLAILIAVATASAVYVKHRKKKP